MPTTTDLEISDYFKMPVTWTFTRQRLEDLPDPSRMTYRQKKPARGDGGLINRVTGLRVLSTIVEHYPTSRDVVHEHKTRFIKKDLAGIASNLLVAPAKS